MITSDEGPVCGVCSKCGADVPSGQKGARIEGGRVICAKCAQAVGNLPAGAAPGQQPALVLSDEPGGAWVLYVVLVVMAVVSGLVALVGVIAMFTGPSGLFAVVAGITGCLTWSWLAVVLRILADIRRRLPLVPPPTQPVAPKA